MSLPLLHAGRTNPGLSAALDLRFALDKSLTAYRGPTPSFSRASTGTYFNSSGVLTTAAINAPRFNHTYNGTSWVSRGLLVEEQRTNLCSWSEQLNDASWSFKTNVTISANFGTAPDGNTTADLIYPTASGAVSEVGKSVGAVNIGPVYTNSYFLKSSGKTWARVLSIRGDYGAWFNLSNGTVGTTLSGSIATIQDVGNGWYRCTVARATDITTGYSFVMVCDSDNSSAVTASGTNGILVWGAQSELGAFPTSYIGTTSSSVVRSADVCQITGADFSGFYNQNEGSVVLEFDGAQPLPSPSPRNFPSYVTISKGNSGYDLETNSFSIFGNSDTNKIGVYASIDRVTQYEIYSTGLFSPNMTQRSSFGYAVNNFGFTNNGENVLTDTSGTNPNQMAYLHLGKSSGGTFSCHIARLRYFNKRLPNETLQLLSEPDPTLNLQFALNKTLTPVAGPAPSFSRASTGTFFNASGVLTSASINTPRFDHVFSGGQWVSRGLLVEEQRTNNCYFSNTFSNAAWEKYDSSISSSGTGPDGSTASLLTENTANGPHWLRQQTSASVASGAGVSVTASIFVKANGRSVVGFGFDNSFAFTGKSVRGRFDLSDGSFANEYNCDSYSVTNVGNGWYRLSVTSTAVQAGIARFDFFLYNSDTSGGITYTGDGSSGVYVFGAQIEQGAFPTSYTGTTSSSVTRSADVCQITGTSFGSMWNQGEGSVVTEWDARRNSGGQFTVYWARDAASSNTVLHTGREALSPPGVRFSVVSSASVSAEIINAGFPDPGVLTKTAGCYKANDFAYAYNGALVGTDASGAVPINPTDIMIGYDPYSNYLNGHISKLIYYPARLTNTKLQQLST